ncbi:MAG: pyridoxal phosphate-dependent aminotransferase [Chromatiales bacterium]|nr:pyridoxal phosphate-dependent aminotransferase [Chromatiales bacterium]
MSFIRPEIEALQQNGITKVALPRIADPKVIPLWFGEGDLVTPDFVREAAKKALDEGQTFYAHTRGRQELRDAIKRYLDGLYGIDLDPARITVPGSTMLGINIAVQMACSSGDRGLIVAPNWPNITNCFEVAGAKVDWVRQQPRDGRWHLDLDELEAAIRPRTRAIFVNTPCNPTGWMMRPDEQARLLAICRERQILLIADEVYHRNVYVGEAAPSFLQIARDDDPVIVVNGFSKAFAMTGWRLGWMVTPPRLATHMAILSECFNTGATVFVQLAGIAALEQGASTIATLRAQYAKGRRIVMDVLGDHPRLDMSEPEGAFYAFPRVRGLRSSLAFAEGVLAEEDVGIAPGYTFGPGSEDHFRICFAQSHDRLTEALHRIRRYLDRHDNEYDAD